MRRLVMLVAIVAVLAAAVYGARWLHKTRPRAKRVVVERKPTLVEVIAVTRGRERVVVVAMGTVIPEKTVVLQPQVTGRIIEQSPALMPGGLLKAGEIIARIDPTDYHLAIEQQKGNVARALFELKVEEGRNVIARREWKLLEPDIPNTDAGRQLALREPHLTNARAALAAARSSLDLAKLNLERTAILAPFNALVTEESIDVGQLVTPQTRLATLVGTDAFRVQAALPVSKLDAIAIPGVNGSKGSKAKVAHEASHGCVTSREGQVVRLLGDLDPAGRMARVLIRFDDPLGVKPGPRLPLLLGAYVRVEIEGKPLNDVYVLPRSALREGNTVWVMDADDRLAIRKVEIAWRQPDTVLIGSGLQPGARVIVSRIPVPIPGMKLRVEDE